MKVTGKYLKDKAELIAKKERYDKEELEYNQLNHERRVAIRDFHENRMKVYTDKIQSKWKELCDEYGENEPLEIKWDYYSWDGHYSFKARFDLEDRFKAKVSWEYVAELDRDFDDDYNEFYVPNVGGRITGHSVTGVDITNDTVNLWKIVVAFCDYMNNEFDWEDILTYSKEDYEKDIANIPMVEKTEFMKANENILGRTYQHTMEELDLNYVLDYSIENKVPVQVGYRNNYFLVTKNTPKSFRFKRVYSNYNGDGYSTSCSDYMKRKDGFLGSRHLFGEDGKPIVLK